MKSAHSRHINIAKVNTKGKKERRVERLGSGTLLHPTSPSVGTVVKRSQNESGRKANRASKHKMSLQPSVSSQDERILRGTNKGGRAVKMRNERPEEQNNAQNVLVSHPAKRGQHNTYPMGKAAATHDFSSYKKSQTGNPPCRYYRKRSILHMIQYPGRTGSTELTAVSSRNR